MNRIRTIYRWAFLPLGLLLMSSLASAATIAIDKSEPFVDLSSAVEYLEDPNQEFTYDQAMATPNWKSSGGETPSLGLTNSAYWFRMTLDYSTGTEPIDRILELAYRDLHDIQVWYSNSPLKPTFHTGSGFPIRDRPIHSRQFAFPIELEPEEALTVVARITAVDSLIAPFHFWTKRGFADKEQELLMAQGIFYGILLVMLFYNGFLFVSIRERTYLFYCGYIAGMLFLQLIMDSTAHYYIYPADNPNFGEQYGLTRISIGTLMMCLSFFARDFLHLPKRRPHLGKLLSIFGGLGVGIILVTPWFDYVDVFFPIVVICCVAVVVITTAGVLSLLDGYAPARFFMAAFGFYFLGALVTLLGVLGFSISSFWTQHAIQIGSAFEVTLLSLALADRINHLKAARTKAEKEAAERERGEARAKRDLEHSHQLLIHSEKLANLGTMIAGLGHEIANPINTTGMCLEELSEEMEDLNEKLMPLFDESPEAIQFKQFLEKKFDSIGTTQSYIHEATQRLTSLSDALRAQSRNEREMVESVDLNEVVRESLIITRAKTAVLVVKSDLGDLPPIRCCRTRVGQIATNLLSNAADVLIQQKDQQPLGTFKGEIAVTTEVEHRDEKPGVLLTVSDNGTGVPEDLKEKIFDQFFTTKPSGVGTGLGLYMCASIVRDHDGILSVDDAPSLGGARFQVWLPMQHH